MKYLLALQLLTPWPLARSMQPRATHPESKVELRSLKLGELNFLHTVDTHGWHGGHLKQGLYSADWGDYISFATKLKEKIGTTGDLILIDSGDRIRGNGLYGADPEPGNNTFRIFQQQGVDILTIGNHELYFPDTAYAEYETMVPAFRDSYLVGNLEIWVPYAPGEEMQPFSPTKVKKMKTPNKGIRITSFGMVYDGAVNETKYPEMHITPAKEMIKEKWFTDAITDEDVDIFVVVGHVPARAKPGGNDPRYKNDGPTEFRAVHDAIRGCKCPNSEKPIHFFGGDYHIRDYVKYGNTSAILASGMYLETVGFASIQGIEAHADNTNVKFNRMYIDNNLVSFRHHTSTDEESFRTPKGEAVTKMIEEARSKLGLDDLYGCADKTYYMVHKPEGHPQNLYTWLGEKVLASGAGPEDRNIEQHKRMMFINKGAMRYDFYEGEFTRDTAWSILPFEAPLLYIPDVSLSDARKVGDALLNPPPKPKVKPGSVKDLVDTWDLEMEMAPHVRYLEQKCPPDVASSSDSQIHLGGDGQEYKRPLGYVTTDDIDSEGDDTVHTQICNYYEKLPSIIQGLNFKLDDDSIKVVDVVFNDYLQDKVLRALKKPGTKAIPYGPNGKSQEMRDFIVEWVKANWKKPEGPGYDRCEKVAAGEVAEL